MPLKATDLPGEIDAFGVRFLMQGRSGPVRCHVFRATIDHLGAEHARTAEDALKRFAKNRRRFEALASDLHDAGHHTPWISVEHLMAGLAPGSFDQEG
jgi:hypothetical protein